jgi:hypothetical protein
MKSRYDERDKERETVDELEDNLNDAVTSEAEVEDCENKVYNLLAGYVDENGTEHKTFTIREMTGKDEEAIHKSDVKSNGSKVISTLLCRCVMSIGDIEKKDVSPKEWENIIKSLYTGDQDIILLEIRKNSIGTTLEADHVCPNPDCKTKLRTIIDMDELEIRPFSGMREIPFTLIKGYTDKKGVTHKEGFMRMPNGTDREVLTPLAKRNLARAETVMLTRICRFSDGAFIDDSVMSNLTTKDRNYLIKLMQDNSFGIEMTADVTCDTCGEEFKVNLNVTNFI